MRPWLRRVFLLSLLPLAACAGPRLQKVGPALDAPRLDLRTIHMPDGADLPLRVWLPSQGAPKAVVLALHGFNDYSRAFAAPGSGLARRGYAVYAYDQRGFGGAPQRGIWAGSARMIGDMNVALGLLRARHPGIPLFILGESMGAAVPLAAIAGGAPPAADGLILVSPAIWGWQTQSALNRTLLDWGAHVLPWLTVIPYGVKREASDNHTILRALAADPLVIKATRIDAAYGLVDLMSAAFDAAPRLAEDGTPRILVLYGGREDILSTGAVADWLGRLPVKDSLRVLLYPKGHHMLLRDLDAGAVYDDIAAWIADPAAASLARVEWRKGP